MYIQGTITVKTIVGRRGPFAVGMLETPLGTFEAKSALLDAFEPGTYEGKFDIHEIFIDHYRTGTQQIVSKLCARVLDIITDAVEAGAASEQQSVAAVEQPAEQSPPVDARVQAGFVPDESPEVNAENTDAELFDDELMQRFRSKASIQLDTAHSHFRAQIKRLKELGYEYQSATRTWLHPQPLQPDVSSTM